MGVQGRSALNVILLLPLLVNTLEQEPVKTLDAFQKDCLDAHNTYRSKHGVQPLVWSEQLAQHAQNWADKLASRDEVKHDLVAINKLDEGENLAFFRPAVPKCQGSMEGNCVLCREMIQRWYDEGKNFDYDAGRSKIPKSTTKHFSQIIWASTSEVGIGTAVSPKFGFITVARYRPRGNIGGTDTFVRNVPPEGGPLPSSFNEPLKVKPKSATSTTPTGNGIPLTASGPRKSHEGVKGAPSESSTSSVLKSPALATGGSNTDGLSNTEAGLLDASAIEKIQGKAVGEVMKDNLENKPSAKMSKLLSMIVDLANKTKESNDNNNDKSQVAAKAKQSRTQYLDSNSTVKADKSGHNGQMQEDSSLDHDKDFSYENAAEHRDSINNGGKEGNAKDLLQSRKAGVVALHNDHHSNGNVDIKHAGNENISRENETQGVKREMNNNVTLPHTTQKSKLDIHTDNGIIDIENDLKNRGLVRTVLGPDGSSAQVFLTKNGKHAGLVFRDHISRVSHEIKTDDSPELTRQEKRFIHVL